jgi:hypothetical protein
MNSRDLLLRLIKIAEQYNMDQKDLPSLVVKTTTLSLKYIDRRELFELLFPDHYIDWDLATCNLTTANALGDTEPWLCLLSLFDWPLLNSPHSKESREIEQNHLPLSQIKASLKATNLDSPGWGTACRVLILQLIQGLQSVHAIEQLTSRMLQRNTRESTMQLLAGLYDSKHIPIVYFKTLAHILSPGLLTVNEPLLNQTMGLITAQREEHRLNLRLKSMQMISLRPRLRDRLKTSLLAGQHQMQVDSKLGTWDSYTGFCHTHRFPNNLSDRVKRQLYFLAAQAHWEWQPHVGRLISNKDMETRVQQHPVLQSDATILGWVIDNLSMDGRPPFPELMAFKARCFNSFPVSYTQKLTLTQVLRLYVSAYQPPNVWKDVWKAQIGMLSPQIIRDIETFVQNNPFAGGRIVDALVG